MRRKAKWPLLSVTCKPKPADMQKRFVAVWFPYLKTDWFVRKHPVRKGTAFVVTAPHHGRLVVEESNRLAQAQGIYSGTVVADARALYPLLQAVDDRPGLAQKLLTNLAHWALRYTPVAAADLPSGLLLDATGCAHLWGGEAAYLRHIALRLRSIGYTVKIAMAGTVGAAWALSRFGANGSVVPSGEQSTAVANLPPASLRLDGNTVERLHKLGLTAVGSFANMPRQSLRRRFGPVVLQRLDQALGIEDEFITPVVPVEPYQERLPCTEPIATAAGIRMGAERLLDAMCNRLRAEGTGLRVAVLRCFRVDGKTESATVTTHRPSNNAAHLMKLFELRLGEIEPALGIEMFALEASRVEPIAATSAKLWEGGAGLEGEALWQLLDRINGKFGEGRVVRYVPNERWWPERCLKPAQSLEEQPTTEWRTDKPRPVRLLQPPERIEVAAPVPDYPPMHFRHKGVLHKIIRADGPERIEQEWWTQEGEHRDYYRVEDDKGCRYWLFRAGHNKADKPHQWFLHGYFG